VRIASTVAVVLVVATAGFLAADLVRRRPGAAPARRLLRDLRAISSGAFAGDTIQPIRGKTRSREPKSGSSAASRRHRNAGGTDASKGQLVLTAAGVRVEPG
jgi:hypothetical protein